MNEVIRAQEIGLTFQTADGPVHALKDVDLTIGQGDFVSFIGPSGCGKTTLLRAIAALETPTEGRLSVNGMEPDAARKARAYGYVFQAPGLYPWRTISGNISLPLEIMGFPRADRRQRTARVLELVDLAGFGAKYPWQLSGGMQQRLQIARNLITGPRLVFMDEPTGGLDVSVQARLLDLLRGLVREMGLSAIIVTHDLAVVRLLADRLMVMKDGHVVETGLTDQVLDDPQHAYTQLLVSSVLQV